MTARPEGRAEAATGARADGGERPEELRSEGGLAAYRLSAWEESRSGLVAGVTAGAEAGDLGLASERSPEEWAGRVRSAAGALGVRAVAVPVQVHGSRVREVEPLRAGVLVPGEADGLCTDAPGVLLAVTVADCVPVFLLDPEGGAAALLHAGWRGLAAGVFEAGVEALEARYGCSRGRLRVHLGPAICGDCYEVGPEVHRALGRPSPGTARLDLREVLRERAARAGLRPDRLTRSRTCTRCGADHFFSHRGTQTPKRMMAFLGWREGGDPV